MALDLAALKAGADILEIDLNHVVLCRVQALERAFLRKDPEEKTARKKPCRSADACAMCKKQCTDRIEG